MTELLKHEIEAICVTHIIAIVLAIVFLMLFIIRAKRDAALYAFIGMQLSIIGWMVFKILKTVSPVLWVRWWSIVSYYFFACAFEVAFLNFTYTSFKGRPLSKNKNIALSIIALIQFSFVITNPFHYMFYATFNFYSDTFGPLFYIHMITEYIIIIVGIYYGARYFNRVSKDESSLYKLVVAVAIFMPLILNLLYVTDNLGWLIERIGLQYIFDITPLVFVFTISVFVYATFRHDFVELSPILRHEIVQKLNTSICVISLKGEMVYANKKMMETLGDDAAVVVENAFEKNKHLLGVKAAVELNLDSRDFLANIEQIIYFNQIQYLVTLDDITNYKVVERNIKRERQLKAILNLELNQTIKQLKEASKVGARRFVAQELHDIVGHSLVVAIKTMEVAKMYFKQDVKLSQASIKDGVLALSDGVSAMNNVRQKKVKRDGYMLNTALNRILIRLRHLGIKVHFSFKGKHHIVDAVVFDTAVKVSQELITNAIKHASPSAIFIAVALDDKRLNIRIIDNGIGCDNLQEGNGLNGIRERLDRVMGSLKINTAKGEGFMSHISIPNKK